MFWPGVPCLCIKLENVYFFSSVLGCGGGGGAASRKRWGQVAGVLGQESCLMGSPSEPRCAGTCQWAKPLCCV